MAPLSTCRLLTYVRPFTLSSIDYFGPVHVTVGRHHEKRYGVLFTCLSTLAVHLDVAHSLTTDAAIMAIRRMIARRGCPKEIHSDNGTNLRGTEKELQTAVASLDQKKIRAEMAAKSIKWVFNPSAAPHMGGS